MEICLLGSLEVLDDEGRPAALAGTRLQMLLTILALRSGEVVSDDQLFEGMWGDEPPARSANALQRQVSTLRQALGASDLVERRSGGYVLNVDRSAIDVFRFEALAEAGRDAMQQGDITRAREMLGEALQLWRGDALAHAAYEEFAQAEIARLNEARLAATELRIDIDLALGHDASLVSELELLVAAHPLREHMRAQLMLALSRSGRPAEALRAYQAARVLLGDELGLEPSSELRALESAIVGQDDTVVRRAVDVAPRPRTNLATPLSSLVGRRSEVAALRPRLLEHRLVTLIGPGGVGKSRLVLDAGHEWFAGGDFEVWMVELGDVSDAGDVVPAVMDAMELPRAGTAADDTRSLVAYLRDRRTVIILDNCEHLVAAAARVTQDLLESCPSARIWATSREGLAVPGEVLWAVPPLALDDAVALFVERGRASDPTFAPARAARDSQKVLEDICTRLDGLPLAIELAAARLRAMPIAELATGLEDRFRVLSRGARTALPRQQTLRAVVDWSYDLLFDDERKVFNRLSVFRGSCALAAARVVCADDDVSAGDVVELIGRLVDKSLVVIEPDEVEGYARCRMLQTLVDYGRDRLEESGDAARMFDAHRRYYTDFAQRSQGALQGEKQRGWLRAVTANLVNLRAALDGALADGDAETAQTIAGCLGWYWWFTGRVPEGSQWLMLAQSCRGEVRDITRARVLAWTVFASSPGFVGWSGAGDDRGAGALSPNGGVSAAELDEMCRVAIGLYSEATDRGGEQAGVELALSVTFSTRGDFARAGALSADAERRLAAEHAPQATAMRAFAAGRLAFVEDRFADAEQALGASIESFAALDVDVHRSFALRYVGRLAALRHDYSAAVSAIESALDIVRGLGLSGFANTLRMDLAEFCAAAGDHARARSMLAQPLTAAREVGSARGICDSLTALAVVEWRVGEPAQMQRYAREGLEVARHIDDSEAAAYCLAVLGWAAMRSGEPLESREHFSAALESARAAAAAPRATAFALEGLADLLLAHGEAETSARLLGAASVYRTSPGRATGLAFAANARIDAEHLLDLAAHAVGSAVAMRAFAAGSADPEGLSAAPV